MKYQKSSALQACEKKKGFEKLSVREKIYSLMEEISQTPIASIKNPPKSPYIHGLSKVVSEIQEAIQRKDIITLVTDYDCDGCMSTIILKMALEALGVEPIIRIPRRFSEGYGLSMHIIDEVYSGTIITADNGIAAIEQIKAAKAKGLKVIVTDHHIGDVSLVDADAVIDPNADGNQSEYKGYCGAGLAYRIAKELIPDKEKLLKKILVFASIATVADVMPLIGDNRNIVKEGLELINRRMVSTGLVYLLSELNAGEHLDEQDYGFLIGPIVNASGRLYEEGPIEVVNFLSTEMNPLKLTREIDLSLSQTAKKLICRNEERKLLVEQGEMYAEDFILKNKSLADDVLVIRLPELKRNDGTVVTEGIIGIIAGRMAEKYRRPCLCFADSKEPGLLKGSGRTFGNFHLKNMLDARSDLFLKYGGHAGAAGMTIEETCLMTFAGAFSSYIKSISYVPPKADVRHYDLDIREEEFEEVLRTLTMLAPFGEGFRRPDVLVSNVKLIPSIEMTGAGNGKCMKTQYAKFLGKNKETLKVQAKQFSGIMFRGASIYQELGNPKIINMIGNPTWNYFGGKQYPQMILSSILNAPPMVTFIKKEKKQNSLEPKFFSSHQEEGESWIDSVKDIAF